MKPSTKAQGMRKLLKFLLSPLAYSACFIGLCLLVFYAWWDKLGVDTDAWGRKL